MGLEDFIEDDLGGTVDGRTDVPVDCIACGKERHMYVNTVTGVAYCFRCGYTASIIKIIRDLRGCSYHEAVKAKLELDGGVRLRMRDASLTMPSLSLFLRDFLSGTVKRQETQAEPVALPECCISITHPLAQPGLRYLRSRGFGKSRIKPYGLFYVPNASPDFKWRNHIIFPVYDFQGTLIYYNSRYAGTPLHGPKANTPRNVHKEGALFGFAQLRPVNRRTAIIVEGPLDAMALHPASVALLGKNATHEQVRRIAAAFKRVVVCLDRDAMEEAISLCNRLSALGCRTGRYEYAEGDAADHIHIPNEVDRIFAAGKRLSGKDEIKARMLRK